MLDSTCVELQPGDRFLLCSDGLHGYLKYDEQVTSILDRDIEEGVEEALRFANDSGGSDNITALIVELTE